MHEYFKNLINEAYNQMMKSEDKVDLIVNYTLVNTVLGIMEDFGIISKYQKILLEENYDRSYKIMEDKLNA